VSFEGEHCIIAHHAVAVVGNFQETSAARFDVDGDAFGAGVNCVLDQLLGYRSGTLDDFTGGDLVGNVIGKEADFGHRERDARC
jgi:hypothetical protein